MKYWTGAQQSTPDSTLCFLASLPVIQHTKKKKRKENPVCVHTTILSSQFHVLHADRRHCSPKFPVCLTYNVMIKKLPVSPVPSGMSVSAFALQNSFNGSVNVSKRSIRIPGDPVTCGRGGTNHHLHHKIVCIPKKCCKNIRSNHSASQPVHSLIISSLLSPLLLHRDRLATSFFLMD